MAAAAVSWLVLPAVMPAASWNSFPADLSSRCAAAEDGVRQNDWICSKRGCCRICSGLAAHEMVPCSGLSLFNTHVELNTHVYKLQHSCVQVAALGGGFHIRSSPGGGGCLPVTV